MTGFLGAKGKPTPIPESEINHVQHPGAGRHRAAEAGDHRSRSASRCGCPTVRSPRSTALVEEVDEEKGRLKVAVSIFGRATPVELEYSQVEKV